MSGFEIVSILILIFVVVIIARSIRIVPQGEQWTLEAFGSYVRTLTPGIHFLIPIYQNVGAKLLLLRQAGPRSVDRTARERTPREPF